MKNYLKNLFSAKLKLTALFIGIALLIAGGISAQLVTYPLVSTGAANFNPSGATNPNVTAGVLLPGAQIENANPNSAAWRIKNRKLDPSKLWPTTPTDGYHFDVPLSPKTGYDMSITSISFIVKQIENGPIDLVIAPMFQIDGAGPWYPLATPYNLTGATNNTLNISVNFPVNEVFYSGHTYVIRFFVYGGPTSDDDDESFRISTLVINGSVSSPPAVKPTITTVSAAKDPAAPKYAGIVTGTYQAGAGYHLAKEKGIVYGTMPNPDLTTGTKIIDAASAAGTINVKITGLSAGVTYCARTYIITQTDIIYGDPAKCFTTDAPSAPVVTTNAIPPANIYSNKVQAGGAIPDSGGLAITEKGLVWNIGGGATTTTNLGKLIEGSGSGSFSDLIKGLKPSTAYCVRAYAINSKGTSYGADVCFTTAAPVPVLSAIPGTLDFGENLFGGLAITLSYTFSGSNLNPGPGTIAIQIPAGFKMGLSSTTMIAGPATLNVSYNGTAFSKPIFVQLPTTTYGTFTGTITCSGGGAAAVDADIVNVKGTIVQSPDDISNVGTDFWTGFAYQEKMKDKAGAGSEAKMSIYISNSGTTSVTARVEMPGIAGAAGFPKVVTVAPGTVAEVTGFPTGDPSNNLNPGNFPDSRLYFTGVTNRGIHITSSAPVSVWMHTYVTGNSAAAAMLFPTNTWGSAYTVQSYGGISNNSNPNAFFFVIAKDDNTLIEFVPANDILANVAGAIFTENHTAAMVQYKKGQTYQLTLNRGQVFNAMGFINGKIGLDLTGTTVKTICDPTNPNAEEKKIAVFGGNGRVLVLSKGCTANSGSDHLVQQMFPSVAWGTEYLTAPTKTMEWNYFRIMPKDMTAKVYVNGTLLTAAAIAPGTNYYEYESNQPLKISSDLPISVIQFVLAGDCAKAKGATVGQGDPEMIILSPVQQAITNTTVYSSNIKINPTGCGSTSASYINVIIKKEGVASFTFDGLTTVNLGTNGFGKAPTETPVATAFKPHPADPNYMYALLWVTCGASHTIKSNYAFNAIAYGMGDGESYGYNAGTALKNLSSIKVSENPYGKDTSTSVVRTCKDNPVTLKIALPYNLSLVDSIVWDPGNDPRISPLGARKGAMNGAVAKSDGVITQDGRDFNIYTSPISYKFSNLGAYQFNVIAYGKFESDCGNKDVQKILVVVGKDNIAFDFNTPSCGSTVVTFVDKTEPMAGTTIKSWSWNFGDNKTDATQNPPAHTYAANPPTYWAKLSTINSVGCISSDSMLIDFSGGMKGEYYADKDSICPGSSIKFAGAENSTSDGSSGTITEWNWNFGDGQTYKGTSMATANPPAHVYNTPGTYTVRMTLKSSLGCVSVPVDTIITVKPLPVANFNLPGGVCIPGTTLFKNTSTIADNTIGAATYKWDFGDPLNSNGGNPNTSTTVDGTHIYVAAPPASPGYYTVKLTATSNFGCVKDTVKQVANVFSPPVASFKLPVGGEVCLNSDSTFVSNSTTTGGQTLANYTWDFGDGKPVQSGAAFSSIKHLFDLPGAHQVKLTVTTNQGCVDDTIQTVMVATPPVADFTWSANTCVNNSVQFTDASTPALSIKGWSWKFGDGATSTSATQSPQHTYSNSGTVSVSFQVFTAAGCPSQVKTSDLIVNPSPVADFTLPNAVCVPGTSLFTNKTTISDGTIATVKYTWDFDDNNSTSTLTDGSHLYTAAKAGGYKVRLTATSSNGCFDDTVKTLLNVFDPPVASFKLPVGSEVCLNSDSSFTSNSTATGGQTFANYSWDFGDGKPVQTGAALGTVKHLYDIAGTHQVRLTVTTNQGCIDDTVQTIKVATPPVANFTWSANTCVNNAVTFTDASTPAAAVKSWSWKFGDGAASVSSTQSPLHTYKNSGPVKVDLQVFTAAGCPSAVKTADLVVNPSPVADFSLPLAICVPGTTVFTNKTTISDGTIATVKYTWDYDDNGSTGTTTDGSHVYTAGKAGGYNIHLHAVSANGCFADTTKNLTDVFEPPVADFTLSRAGVCENETVVFTDASTVVGNQQINKWDWAFGDTKTGSGQTVSHAYPGLGTYNAVLTVTTNKGCVSKVSLPQTIKVNQNPKVSFATKPGICLEAAVRQLNTSTAATETTGQAGTFTYSGTGVESNGLGGFQFNPAVSGGANTNGYSIKAVFETTNGCKDSASSLMKVFPTPLAKWTVSSPVCEKNSVKLTDASVAGFGKIVNWQWNMGDGSSSAVQSPSHVYAVADTFNVTLKVTTDSGCVSTVATQPLIAHYLPVVDIILPGALCLPNAQGNFKDNSTIADGTANQFSYKWEFGDGGSSALKDPAHTYASAVGAPFRVQLTVTSSNGCVDSLPQRRVLTNLFPPPVPDFTSIPNEVCLGDSILFSDHSNGVTSNINKWFWRFGDNEVDSVSNSWHTYATANAFDVRLTVTNGEGCSASIVKKIKVNSYPKIKMTEELWIKAGTTTVLRPTVTDINSTNVTYQWSPANYLDQNNIKNPVSSPLSDQVYVLTVTAGSGCAVKDTIAVNLLRTLRPPNAFSPNGDGINDVWNIPYLVNYAGASVEIYDRYGRIAWKSTGYAKPWDGTYNGKPLPTGVYYYVIDPKSGFEPFTGSVTLIR